MLEKESVETWVSRQMEGMEGSHRTTEISSIAEAKTVRASEL